ncbi:hypothetical_protein [Leishmania major strain Friedlin]|nr:hypothetical_protein [Leishmania major strain Friedlin]
MLRLEATEGEARHAGGVPEGPGLGLADLLLERTWHAPGPPPITGTTDATALGQDPGRGPPGSRRAVRPSRSGADDGALMRRDEEGQAEPVGRMAPTRRRNGLAATTRIKP